MTTTKNNLSVPTRLLNTPLLVSADEADLVAAVLRGDISEKVVGLFNQRSQRNYDIMNSVAVLPILGGLTYRGYGWYWRASYDQIRSDFRTAMADPDVSAVVFDVDSPGGEVAGCFDLVDEIFQARGDKPIYAMVNENCYSAAYAIASAADKVFIPRTGSAGSIGVIALHYEQSKLEDDVGVKFTAIFAGKHKNDFSIHEPLSADALKAAQERVDASYDLFCETVARNRGLEVDQIKKTEAAIFKGEDAVAAGLADAVASWDQAMAQISSNLSSGGSIMTPEQVRAGLAAMIGDPATKADALQLIQALGFVPATEQADLEAKTTEAREAGYQDGYKKATDRAAAIAGACELAGMGKMCQALLKEEGLDVEGAQTRITEARAAESGSQQVNSATRPIDGGGENALIKDAKKRAGIQ